MTASDTTSLVLAASANAAGIVVAVGMWRRAKRRRRAVRASHPSVQTPMAVDLVPGAEGWSLRVDVRRGAPPLSLDIVSYRPPTADGIWDSVPIVDPVRVESGVPAVLPTTLPPSTDAADVVIAWTSHHPTGELQDSRLLRVTASRAVPAAPSRSGVLGGRLTLALIGLLAGSMVLVVRSAAVGDAPEEAVPSSATTEPLLPSNTSTSDLTVETSPVTPSPSTAPPVTPTDPPVTTVATTATAAPATAPAATNAIEPDRGPRVLVEARSGPCRFADDCLIAGFAIEGFDSRPQQYVCEFEDGSRFTFRFDSDGVDDACATGSAEGSIAIEVEGVRSATVTRADV